MNKILQSALMSTWKNKIHFKCRQKFYPRTNNEIERFPVPDEKVKWTEEWSEYRPVSFTSSRIQGQPWADPEIGDDNFLPKWNSLDGKLNRKSHDGDYSIVSGNPMNPVGRTGICGRGVLGRWGPNHAADSIVTRWLKDDFDKQISNRDSKKPILEFVAIQRKNGGEWAIPGGMVDPGEDPHETARREFLEEAMNIENLSETETEKRKKQIAEIFNKKAAVIYKGYVDDPRNTDNAWMETVAFNCHLDGSEPSEPSLNLVAGSDAQQVCWLQIERTLNLFASHLELIHQVAEKHGAHF